MAENRARRVKRFSIEVHVSLAVPRETRRDKAIDLQVLSVDKAKLIVMSFFVHITFNGFQLHAHHFLGLTVKK